MECMFGATEINTRANGSNHLDTAMAQISSQMVTAMWASMKPVSLMVLGSTSGRMEAVTQGSS